MEEDELKLMKAEQVKEDKIAGLARKEANSKYSQMIEDIAKEHAQVAAQNAKDLEEATKKFKQLETEEINAIEKLKVTQTTHNSAQIELDRVI